MPERVLHELFESDRPCGSSSRSFHVDSPLELPIAPMATGGEPIWRNYVLLSKLNSCPMNGLAEMLRIATVCA
jgi:hypothetical protein